MNTSSHEQQTWTITDTSIGDRLDIFLTSHLIHLSRSAIQKAIKQGSVTVNGKKATVHKFLKEGDVILYTPLVETVQNPFTEEVDKPLPRLEDFIVDETPDWIVIDKPAGLLVHPDAKTKKGTLIDLLVAHAPQIAKVGEDPERPGIVHRLDREVSGLMVIAKTQAAYDSLKEQFAQRTTEKSYLALVHGNLPSEEGDIKFRIARSSSKARMAARPSHEEEGKAAWTHYRVKERYRGATLAEIEIYSGRTHQIRAHMHAMGCPVIGDTLYALKKTERNITSPRLLLQSVSLIFRDPSTGEDKRFSLAPDPAFARTQAQLRSTSL